ncbi:MAG: translation initiation factor IF-3 [Candidatus Vecturithrix sp.]|nr:translation initiation factor IF-3 [Candidatus Vecturithrix sp.]
MKRKKASYSQKAGRVENRINLQIQSPELRVVGPDGEQLGILSRDAALNKARELGLDLVEVAPTADPPVCKVMDYGKFRYQQQKRAHEAKKKQTVIQIKEVKVRPKIDEHDFQFKLNHVKRFLEGGDKAKISVVFRGREIVHKDLGQKLIDRFLEATQEIAEVESPAKMEGRNMTVVLVTKSQKSEKKSKP